MARAGLGVVGHRVAGLFRDGTAAGLGEGALLDRFVSRGDEAAFEALVARHGPMVWSVCRRALRDPNDAEDAFQATFLVLARRAGSIRGRDRLAGWLHGVACKVAARARREAARKPSPIRVPTPTPAPDDDASRRERAALLHEEIDRLPGKYREPIVLCHLEGCTHDEAAARLGWPVGTVRGRLARGRDRLRDRLIRRGLAAPGALEGWSWLGSAIVGVPDALGEVTVRAAAASRLAAGVGRWFGTARAARARGVEWAEGVRRTMLMNQLRTFAAMTLTAGLLAAGAAALTLGQSRAGGPSARPEPVAQEPTAPKPEPRPGTPQDDDPVKAQREALERKEERLKREEDRKVRQEVLIREISKAEAETEDLRIRVDVERTQLVSYMNTLKQFENPIPQDRRLGVSTQALDEMKRRAEEVREQFLRDRTELAAKEKHLAIAQQELDALGATPSDALPPGLERRLWAIESALKQLREQVRQLKR
jgi:RNA polymerase sigma factor (sigma-70 family)